MSAQIDIISERSELGQGSWVRLEEIGKASTATLDDRYRFAARSVNLTWRLCVKRSQCPFADELERKAARKRLFAGFLLLPCDSFGDLPREDREFFRFSGRMLLEISAVDTQIVTTLHKKVINIRKRGRRFVILADLLLDRWRYHRCYCFSRIPVHAELRGKIGLGAAFRYISGGTRFSASCKKFAQNHDLQGTVAGPRR